MFDVPIDAWYAWLGVAVTGVAALGVASALPTAPPPDAAGVADTVDRVATTDHAAVAVHPVEAGAVRLGPRRIGLRNDAGAAHATLAFGPVTPAHDGTRLETVLDGAKPDTVFDSSQAFEQALAAARGREPSWTAADGAVRVRHLEWRGHDVTLVGA